MRTSHAWRQTAAILLGLLCARPAAAGDLSGSARVYSVRTRTAGAEQDALSQDYSLRLTQPLTPWLGLFVGFQSSDYDLTDDVGGDLERRSREPTVELTYRKDIVSARLGARERKTRGSSDADVLDLKSLYGQFALKPARGPYYTLRLDRSSNSADVAVFGRDLDTRNVAFNTGYTARAWTARYALEDFRLDNNLTGYRLSQQRNIVQATYADRFLEDKLRLSSDWLVSRTDQDEQAPGGQTLAEPLPALEGLAAIDTTPDLGPLDPTPTLIDGDTTTPAVPRLDIGGANTFRNLGVDLGFTQQVTRLEVTVDSLSDPALVWQAYRSPDNLSWSVLAGVTSEFDATFLRYTLRFPETTDRYFKAVNVSVNSRPSVAITEVRALLDVQRLGRRKRQATTERAYVQASLRPTERVRGDLTLGYNSNNGSGGPLPVQDTRELDLGSLVSVSLTGTTTARIQYHQAHFERGQAPVLSRDERRYVASVAWTPIPTVDTLLSATRREDAERGTLLRRSQLIQARASTELLPDLRLTSEIGHDRIADPFSGFDLTSWTWRETFDMRPIEALALRGGWSMQRFDASGRLALRRRDGAYGRADWQATPHFGLSGDWTYGTEDGRRTLTQIYSLSWAPGPRLTVAASSMSSQSIGDVETKSASASLDYRINQYLSLFADASRSELNQALVAAARVTSLQFGLALAF